MFYDLKDTYQEYTVIYADTPCATNFLISQSEDIYHLAKLLGYSEVSTIEIYLNIASFIAI